MPDYGDDGGRWEFWNVGMKSILLFVSSTELNYTSVTPVEIQKATKRAMLRRTSPTFTYHTLALIHSNRPLLQDIALIAEGLASTVKSFTCEPAAAVKTSTVSNTIRDQVQTFATGVATVEEEHGSFTDLPED